MVPQPEKRSEAIVRIFPTRTVQLYGNPPKDGSEKDGVGFQVVANFFKQLLDRSAASASVCAPLC